MQSASGSYRNLAALADDFVGEALTQGKLFTTSFACVLCLNPACTRCVLSWFISLNAHINLPLTCFLLLPGGPLSFGNNKRKPSRNSIDSQEGRNGNNRQASSVIAIWQQSVAISCSAEDH